MFGISGSFQPIGMGGSGSQSLNDTQKQKLDELLANYDTENLTDEQAKEVVDGIKELDIAPGRGLAEALGSFGINARDLASQAGLGRPPGPPNAGQGGAGAGGKGPESAAVQALQSVVETLLEATENDSDDSDFQTVLVEALEAAGIDTSSPVLDFKV